MPRRLFAFLSAIALAGGASLAASVPAWAAGENAQFTAVDGTDWGWSWLFVLVLGAVILAIGVGLWWLFRRNRRKQDPI